ncbi:hypothetical protein AB0I55_14610 [Actinocatenispora sera]|uniref:hypothetical protein n=1 Tax=Actinocatenispora sera TaxID=390989 RepID=UPI0033FEA1CC
MVLGTFLTVAVASCGRAPVDDASKPGNSPTAAVTSATPCRLTAVENGFTARKIDDAGVIEWAAVIENKCDRVAYGVRVHADALDRLGKEIKVQGGYVGGGADLSVIMPGQTVAVAGTIDAEESDPFTTDDVKSLKVTTGGTGWSKEPNWITVDELTKKWGSWPRVRAVKIHLSARDKDGSVWIDFDLRASGGRTATLMDPFGVVVLRDRIGNVVSGERIQIADHVYQHQRTGVWIPARADPSKTEVYVNQQAPDVY